jgi:hypothetical protein
MKFNEAGSAFLKVKPPLRELKRTPSPPMKDLDDVIREARDRANLKAQPKKKRARR